MLILSPYVDQIGGKHDGLIMMHSLLTDMFYEWQKFVLYSKTILNHEFTSLTMKLENEYFYITILSNKIVYCTYIRVYRKSLKSLVMDPS